MTWQRFGTTAACILGFLAVTLEGQASVQVGDRITLSNGPGSPGGIFHVDDINDGPGLDFDTFCVEVEEYIGFGITYAVEDIGLVTKLGNRTLSSFTAWLYNSFLDNTLNNFIPNAADANTLQLGIWKGMGYTEAQIEAAAHSTTWYDTYNALLNSKGWATDFANSGWVGTGDIFIMNLRRFNNAGEYTSHAQDQLVRLPRTATPEPMSVVIWSCLVAAVAGYRCYSVRRGAEPAIG